MLGIALARINENAKNVVDAVKAKLAVAQAPAQGRDAQCRSTTAPNGRKALKTAESALVEGCDPGGDRAVPVPRRDSARPSS